MSILIKELKYLDIAEYVSFCDSNSNCWVHHKGIAFIEDKKSISFVLIEEGRIIAICPIILETKAYNGTSFNIGTLFGLSLPGPVVSDAVEGTKHLHEIKKMIYDYIQAHANQHNIAKIVFNFSSYYYAGKPFDFRYDELTRYGFLNSSLKMILLDLRTGEEEWWKKLSKGHRSVLKKFIDIAECEYVSYNNLPLGFDRFSEIALTIEKFPEPNLKYLHALYNKGHVEFCHLIYKGCIAGSALFLKYGKIVQYHEAERFTDEDIPAHHLLLWKAMKRYKQEGYQTMDLGTFSYFPQLNYIPSKKAYSVAVFKRGFGGKIAPFFVGEKYYNRAYFEQEYLDRIARYKDTI